MSGTQGLGREIGSLFGPIGGVAGGIVDRLVGGGGGQQYDAQSARDLAYYNAANQWQMFHLNREMAYDMAQHGIRYRVEDAKRAGLHPLAALGASPGQASGGSFIPVGDSGMFQGDAPSRGGGSSMDYSSMGQDLQRSFMATRTPVERELTAFEMARQKQQLQHGDLQNIYLASQIARMQRDQIGPPMAAGAGAFQIKPNEITSAQPDAPHITAGPAHPAVDYTRLPGGHYMATPAKPMQIDEISSPGWAGWMYRNKILPFFQQLTGREPEAAPPKSALPPGASHWHFSFPGTWQPVFPRGPSPTRGHIRGYQPEEYGIYAP